MGASVKPLLYSSDLTMPAWRGKCASCRDLQPSTPRRAAIRLRAAEHAGLATTRVGGRAPSPACATGTCYSLVFSGKDVAADAGTPRAFRCFFAVFTAGMSGAAEPSRCRILQRTLGWATQIGPISLRRSANSLFAHPLSLCGRGIGRRT